MYGHEPPPFKEPLHEKKFGVQRWETWWPFEEIRIAEKFPFNPQTFILLLITMITVMTYSKQLVASACDAINIT